ncbi:uncharacterized protein LOC110265415 [Arachis ipaensis]|uniref:uncharacterized protein LOC110265415 n=1 Tax=Arachis ipaensis TaxID=130454 RepID=UPI000A2B49E0|nr:uncharacterized protein LOC110265415 [Arachis ipaensis]
MKGQNTKGKGDTFHHCLTARVVSLSQTATVLAARSRCRSGYRKPLPSLCLLGLSSDDFISKLRLPVDHRNFWPLSELPPGQFGIAAGPFYYYRLSYRDCLLRLKPFLLLRK